MSRVALTERPQTPIGAMSGSGDPQSDAPTRRPPLPPGALWEVGGSAVAAVVLVALVFSVAGISAPLGMVVLFAVVFFTLVGIVTWRLHGILVMKDRLATLAVWTVGLVALAPLVQIIWYITSQGAPVAFSHFPDFFVHDMAQAGPTDPVWYGGMGHAIVGSAEQVGLATFYTVPIAILTATNLTESDTRFTRIVRVVVDAMMGTPSIIAGLFVYLFWVEPRKTAGYSGFAASLALAVLMLPIMIRTAEEVIRVVPGLLRESALAVGAPQWRMVMQVVLPTALTGLITAIILGVALAVGETAPVLFTAHGTPRYNWSPFNGPQQNLPLQVFQLIRSPYPNYVRDGFGGAFILVALVLILFVMARLVGSTGTRRFPSPLQILRSRRPKEIAL
jgi:phosphate transport system permease protein